MIYRGIKVKFVILEVLVWQRTEKRLRIIKFGLLIGIGIGYSFRTCTLEFVLSLWTNTSKIATKSAVVFHRKSYNIDSKRMNY